MRINNFSIPQLTFSAKTIKQPKEQSIYPPQTQKWLKGVEEHVRALGGKTSAKKLTPKITDSVSLRSTFEATEKALRK
jgi:hypothetical protein